jgi:FHS family L-fucose permease-like MFS transporter
VVHTYIGLAVALIVVAAVVWSQRKSLVEAKPENTSILQAFDLFRRPRFRIGVICIFLYVGAEVAIGSLIVSYLMQPDVLGITQEAAGKHVPFYWGGALVGRFIGAWLLRFVSPGKVLATVAGLAILLLGVSANSSGLIAGWALLGIGLVNAIMFPTIFSLASQGLGTRAADGSGIICMAIVGGAIIPPLTGHIADLTSLAFALLVPACCYSVILGYGIYARRVPEAV